MKHSISQSLHIDSEAADPKSEVVAKLFPHLAILRRSLTSEEIKRRALLEMWNVAALVLRKMDRYDKALCEAMVTRFVDRISDRGLLSKFDPGRGEIEGFIYGVFCKLALECLSERSHHRVVTGSIESLFASVAPGPDAIAERKDLMQKIRELASKLSQDQRNAIARRYTALADLDDGAPIRNEALARHRGLKRLRQWLMNPN